eukprot:TRINITY_DN5077_c0_g1_i1.p1 TRINITY_DN5077_c0_g1~~TRINITY_DN5077_c0_g1_i1.p1  ORF type:complete len:366 (+),score=53.55 TRINITY_DN5077_c0_g1_i1:62-1099(+)
MPDTNNAEKSLPPWAVVPDSWVPQECFEFPQGEEQVKFVKRGYHHDSNAVYNRPVARVTQKWQYKCEELVLPFGSDLLELYWGLGSDIANPKKLVAEWKQLSLAYIHLGFPKETVDEGDALSALHIKYSLNPTQTRLSYIQFLNWLFDTTKGLFFTPPVPNKTREWKSEILSQHSPSDFASFTIMVLKMLHQTQHKFTDDDAAPVPVRLTPNEFHRLKEEAANGNTVVSACLRSLLQENSIKVVHYDITYSPIRLFITTAHYFQSQLFVSGDTQAAQFGVELKECVKKSMSTSRSLIAKRKKIAKKMQSAPRWTEKLGGDTTFNADRIKRQKSEESVPAPKTVSK